MSIKATVDEAPPPNTGTEATEEASYLVSSQDIPCKALHPMKLISLLRARFGVDRYEVSVSYLQSEDSDEALQSRALTTSSLSNGLADNLQ